MIGRIFAYSEMDRTEAAALNMLEKQKKYHDQWNKIRLLSENNPHNVTATRHLVRFFDEMMDEIYEIDSNFPAFYDPEGIVTGLSAHDLQDKNFFKYLKIEVRIYDRADASLRFRSDPGENFALVNLLAFSFEDLNFKGQFISSQKVELGIGNPIKDFIRGKIVTPDQVEAPTLHLALIKVRKMVFKKFIPKTQCQLFF